MMQAVKPQDGDRIRLLADVRSGFDGRLIPKGTYGAIVECYSDPEGYAIDLTFPAPELVGGRDYENVVLERDRFKVVESADAGRVG